MSIHWYPTPRLWPRLLATGAVVYTGFRLRLYVGSLGWNHDFYMWKDCVEIAKTQGIGAVYAQDWHVCTGYNYSPVWVCILLALDKINMPLQFSLTWMLSFVDLTTAALLWRWWDWQAAALYWLCPISIIISAYHRQFDCLALLIGLTAMKMLEE